jgi:hypothetical protein
VRQPLEGLNGAGLPLQRWSHHRDGDEAPIFVLGEPIIYVGTTRHGGLAALAPLNTGDPVGFFVRGEDDRSAWYVDLGEVGVADSAQLTYPAVPTLDVPLAVVFGSRTASSGEAVVLSLLGQDGVRSFGVPTVGKASANTRYPLSDGSAVFLTTTLMADRSGVPIPLGQPIAPDELVQGSEAAVTAAASWLRSQGACP